MDPVTTVIVSAATALANAIATDSWSAVKAGVKKVFGRAGNSQAELADAELARVDELLRSGADMETVRTAAYDAWLARFRELLESNPELAADLRDELGTPDSAAPGAIYQYNRPGDRAVVNAPIHGDVNNWQSPQDGSR